MKNLKKAFLSEIERKANKNQRHYRKNDGTAKCVISNANINYYDENEQKWKHTDNTITEVENCYETNLGKFNAKLSKNAEKSYIEVFDKDKSISWEYLGLNKPKERKSSPKVNVKKNIINDLLIGSKINYKNIDEGVDIQYVMTGNNVKENIIVRKKQDSYCFKFEYKVIGLELRKSETGDKLEFYSSTTNNVVFTIPAPYMYDANNIKSTDVYYEVETKLDSTYIVSVVASNEWINSKTRKFPVIIDPQLKINDTEIFNCKTKHIPYECFKDHLIEREASWNEPELSLKNSIFEKTQAYLHINVKEMNLNITDIYNANITLTLDTSMSTVATLSNVEIQCEKSVDSNAYTFSESLTGNGTTLTISITDCLEVAQDEIVLILTATTESENYYEFCGGTFIDLDIEYFDITQRASNQRVLPLIGGAEEHFDMFTGDSSTTFKAIEDENIGVTISNVIKASDDDFCCGENVRLNIHEKLVKNSDSNLKSNYIYTDSFGDKHYFKETLYYLDYEATESGKELKKKVIHDKSRITIAPNGKLLYNSGSKTYEVHRTEATFNGLKATTKLEGFKNIDLFEHRISEQKDIENRLVSYKKALEQFVISSANEDSFECSKISSVEKDLSNIETFKNAVDQIEQNYLLTKDEYINLKSIIAQKEQTNANMTLVVNSINLKQDSLNNSRHSLLDSKNALLLQKAKLDNKNVGIITEVDRYPALRKQIETIKVRSSLNVKQLEYLLLSTNDIGESGEGKIADVYANCGSNNKHSLNMSLWTTTNQSEVNNALKEQNIAMFASFVVVDTIGNVKDTLKITGNGGSYKVSFVTKGGSYNTVNAALSSFSNCLLLSKTESDTLYALNNELIQITRSSSDDRNTSNNIDNYINIIDQINTISEQLNIIDNQINALDKSSAKEDWDDLLVQKEILEKQDILLIEQINSLKSRSDYNIETFIEYYKEYLYLKNESEILLKHIPVSYITSGDYIKGFNDCGDLVVIYDKHNKHISLEYDQYYDGTNMKYRVSRIIDENDNEIAFSYSEDNLLSEIIDSQGRITKYTYKDNSKILDSITYFNGEFLRFSKSHSGNTVLSSKYEYSEIWHSNSKLTGVDNISTIGLVSHNNVEKAEYSDLISGYTIKYSDDIVSVMEDLSSTGYICKFNIDGEIMEEYEISNGVVVSAAKYTYYKDDNAVIIYTPAKNKLYIAYEDFSFDTNDSRSIKYDDFDKIEQEIIYSNSTGQTLSCCYIYDNYDRLIKKRTNITTITNNKEVCQVQIFEYDKSNRLLCTKSYTEGKELTIGINIEEHIYDKNGFEIKTVSYNSLDPSSKIYKECEVDENGQVKSEFDQSGMFKTIFDGNTAIQPNGARLSYGYSVKDGNSAITISTEDGEENSTQTLYTNGLATKVISGDNVYEYAYDFKGRVKKIQINGDEHVSYDYSKEGLIETITATFADGHSEIYQESPEMQSKEIRGENVNVSQKITKVLSGGKITSITQQENGVNVNVTEYSYYENDGRLKSERFYEYLADGSKNEIYGQTYTYNDDGQLNYKTINSTTNPRVMNNKYKYDKNSKLLSYQCFEQGITISPKTDCLDRNRGKSISMFDGKIYSEDITYLKQGDHATALPLTISYGRKIGEDFVVKENIKYKYDNMGNITKVYENGELVTEYKYDALNRLVRENNKALNKTYVFLYDNKGNIIKKKEYPFTIKCDEYLELDLPIDAIEYTYANDKLIAFSDKIITYDESGKLLSYKDNEISWSFGNRLASYGNNTFNYDAQGRRVSKNDIVYKYNTQNQIFSQSNGIKYFYDNNSMLYAFLYDEKMYFYKKDLLGNVIEILDNTGTTVVKYVYDAWGNHIVKTYDENGDEIENPNHIGHINPIRYRGYYYDTETGLYYLQSRYYDPETGRFMSMDDITYLDPETINGSNLYTYCGNNPVMRVDFSGCAWDTIIDIFFLFIGIDDYLKAPTDAKAAMLLLDFGLALTPFVPNFGSLRHLNKVDDVIDLTKMYGHIDNFADAGGVIRMAKKSDFANNGWDLVRGLNKTDDGFTISNHIIGSNIHKKFMKTFKINKSNIADGIDTINDIVFELKPYNIKSIKKGIKQLYRYRDALIEEGYGFYKMVLVLY